MNESVQILIEADDKASAKFENVSEAMGRQVKQIKDVGGKAKASTELVGTLANSLGGTAFGSFAGQLAQVTERVSAFSEVAKEGGAGALAFKAGLAGVVGVLGFEVGQALGNAVFETERWKEELAGAKQEAQRLAGALAEARGFAFSQRLEEARLFADPESTREELKQLLDQIEADIEGKAKQLEGALTKTIDPAAWMANPIIGMASEQFGKMFGDSTEQAAFVDGLRAELEQLRGQRTELDRMLSDRKANNDAIREQLALQEKTTSYIDDLRRQVEYLEASRDRQIEMDAAASGVAEERRSEVEFLLRMRDAAEERLELEKQIQQQAEAAAKQRQAELNAELSARQQMAKSHLSAVDSIRAQVIEMREGREAAQAYQLELQGFAAADAKALASAMGSLDGLRQSITDGSLTATQGRLLTRGSGSDPMIEQAKTTAQATTKAAEVLQRVERTLQRIEQKELFELLEYSV